MNMTKKNKKHLAFDDVPLRSQQGIKTIEHYCLKCGQRIGNQEATDSSMKIRKLCTGESLYLWDVWVSDFCANCSDYFKTWDDFVDFIKNNKEVKNDT